MPKQTKPKDRVLAITVSALLSAIVVVGLVAANNRKPKKANRQAAPQQKQAKTDPVFEHGFRVGFGMAKTGMIKPKSDELDAMARQAALQMGKDGGLGFKMVWKNGFSMGWMQSD